jgi:hypothetical protein
LKCQAACDKIFDHVDKCVFSDYEYSPSLEVIREECEACATIEEMFEEMEAQKL